MRTRTFRPYRGALSLMSCVALLAACADTPTGLVEPGLTPELNGNPSPQRVTLCKIGPNGSQATFSMSATGGVLDAGTSVTLNATTLEEPTGCATIWSPTAPDAANVFLTVTESWSTPGVTLDRIVVWGGMEGFREITGTNTVTMEVNFAVGGTIYFKNVGSPDRTGTAGCTPGYWKQRHHYDSWVGYSPDQLFSTVFSDAFPGKTLGQVVGLGGGGLNALGRHTVAALLNASSGVDYLYSVSEVISSFNAAYLSRNYETQKDDFAEQNELGCPLN